MPFLLLLGILSQCLVSLVFLVLNQLLIRLCHKGNGYSLYLIEHIIDDLPKESIMGFDHSGNINPLLHHFTKIIKQSNKINRQRIDQQHYHVVSRIR